VTRVIAIKSIIKAKKNKPKVMQRQQYSRTEERTALTCAISHGMCWILFVAAVIFGFLPLGPVSNVAIALSIIIFPAFYVIHIITFFILVVQKSFALSTIQKIFLFIADVFFLVVGVVSLIAEAFGDWGYPDKIIEP
jgi:hypothetical protein